MASFSHTVAIAQPPAEVFPWLLEQDRVPRWTGSLESYEVLGGGPVGEGSRVHQILTIGERRIDVELEITRHEPPREAESQFSTNGIDVVTAYRLDGDGDETKLTQTLEAKATSFAARMLVPIVQPRLERKLTEDLERLRELLQSS